MEQEHIDDIIMDIQLQENIPLAADNPPPEPEPVLPEETVAESPEAPEPEETPAEPEETLAEPEDTPDESEKTADEPKETSVESEETAKEPEDAPAESEEDEEATPEPSSPTWISFFTKENIYMMLIVLSALVISALTLFLKCYRITMNEEHYLYFSLSNRIEHVVTRAGIDLKDNYVITVDYPSPVAPMVTVHTDFDVTMQADGTTQTMRLAAGTDRNGVLAAFGIVMDEDDIFSMAHGESLADHCTVIVNRVEIRTETYEEAIACPVQDLTQPELGSQTLAAPGREGLRRVKGIRTYVDGVITDVVELESEILRHPTTTVLYSEQPIPGAGNGKPTDYAKTLTCESTAYCLKGTTASGKKTQKGYVAVDPSVIPLGTWLYIESLTPGMEDYGYCIAADTGGAIVGNMVDVYFYTEQECLTWGRRNIKVYILG